MWWAYTRGGRLIFGGGAYSWRFTVVLNFSLFLELAKRYFARQNEEIQSEIKMQNKAVLNYVLRMSILTKAW